MALIFCAVVFRLGLQWHTNWVVYLVTMPAGFVMLILSLVKVWRRKIAPSDPRLE